VIPRIHIDFNVNPTEEEKPEADLLITGKKSRDPFLNSLPAQESEAFILRPAAAIVAFRAFA
jgi:hypothetical protein